jgi:hypothetical protein
VPVQPAVGVGLQRNGRAVERKHADLDPPVDRELAAGRRAHGLDQAGLVGLDIDRHTRVHSGFRTTIRPKVAESQDASCMLAFRQTPRLDMRRDKGRKRRCGPRSW